MKNHGEGLQAMAGLIPDSAAEEGDESIKMQVTPTPANLKSLSFWIKSFNAVPASV